MCSILMLVNRDIIVIGASLGGIEAIRKLASGFPAHFQAAVMIVLHTGDRSPMFLADIFGRATSLPVSYAQEGDEVRPGHVYIAPPAFHLTTVAPGHLHLDQGPKVKFSRPSADVLFRSAAELYGPRVIGVVLTGGDSDGTDGVKAIKAAGGMSVVQEPMEARDPGMPSNALSGDHPDYKVLLDDMAALLVRLVTE